MTTKKKNATLSALETSLASQLAGSDLSQPETARKSEPKKKKVSFPTYPPTEVYEQLRRLAFEERTSINALTLEAWDLLFKNRGLKGVKELIKGS